MTTAVRARPALAKASAERRAPAAHADVRVVGEGLERGRRGHGHTSPVTIAPARPAGGYSAVVGLITAVTAETRLAGKPPWRACSRTISSLGAM